MKRHSIIYILLFAMGLSFGMSSCEDMLTADLERHQTRPAQDTLYSYWGILTSLQNIAERYVVLGECRGDLVDGTSFVSDTINSICAFDKAKAVDGSCRYLRARDYYHVINSCNSYLAYADTFRVTGTNEKYMLKEYAQVEAIRAWVYLQLVQVYGSVPFYTKPMLTTADMDAFINNPSSPKATRDNLPDLLASKLIAVKDVEMPNYGMYGISSDPICHSRRCMFPVNLVLGDIYLLRGTKADCIKAAECYYEYLEENKAMLPLMFYYGLVNQSTEQPIYNSMNTSYLTRTTEPTSSDEVISVIPSNKNKLNGNVLRGINTLFGFTPTISVADTSSNATIYLTLNYEKELGASQGYFDLCKQQVYEEYIGESNKISELLPKQNEELGDARQYWVEDYMTSYGMGGMAQQGQFVMKQNPNMAFTTVYPIIYRKATVWLRFAEAINRAGFPGYAFAILKNGICNNAAWFASSFSDFEYKAYRYFDKRAAVRDYFDNKETLLEIGVTVANIDSIPVDPYFYYDNTAEEPEYTLNKEDLLAAGVEVENIDSVHNLNAFNNRQRLDNQVVCNYISLEETLRALETGFLFFNRSSFAGASSTMAFCRRTNTSMGTRLVSISTSGGTAYGVHSRGCGMLRPDEQNSAYSFEKAVKGVDPTITDLYDPNQQDAVIEAVESLIVDEMALETAFEGNRFFDLMRVALRRGDPAFLADKVARRKGSENIDYTLRSRLMDPKNWYFDLPNY